MAAGRGDVVEKRELMQRSRATRRHPPFPMARARSYRDGDEVWSWMGGRASAKRGLVRERRLQSAIANFRSSGLTVMRPAWFA